jgi:ATPase subunit of ABC transporter with duplicated ATPase domains
VLRIDDITLRRGARVLLENASMHVHPGHKVGLVGPNGSGKSSLFALIRGELHADAGEVAMPPRWVLAHVAQETPALDQPALEFVIDGDEELRAIEAELASAAGVRLARRTRATTRSAATRRARGRRRCSRAWASASRSSRARYRNSRAAGA